MASDHDNLVLIVDDEDMNLIVLSKILSRAGFAIETAKNGQIAIDRVKKDPMPRVILMDIMMPEMNGWDATKILKADSLTRHIPVLAVTALSKERDAAMNFGFDGFCPKPIDFPHLINMIHGLLDKSA